MHIKISNTDTFESTAGRILGLVAVVVAVREISVLAVLSAREFHNIAV